MLPRTPLRKWFVYSLFGFVVVWSILLHLWPLIKALVDEVSPESLYPKDFETTEESLERIWRQLIYRPKQPYERPKVKIFTPDYDIYMSPDERNFSGCAVQNCEIVKGVPPENLNDLHAAIRQSCESPNCLSIFFNMESPVYSYLFLSRANLTATYLLRSDVPAPYGLWLPQWKIDFLKSQNLLPWSLSQSWPSFEPSKNYAAGKNKKIAWFVSHCAGSRMNVTRDLHRLMPVDIYGECGLYECERGNKSCSELLNRAYKFYLAFENSLCEDYVTEKLYDIGFQHDIIPIVYGAPKAFHASAFARKSYIHVSDFPTIRDLARYLEYLDNNDAAYSEYFRFRTEGRVISSAFWCRLCAVLNTPNLERNIHNIDLGSFWNATNGCEEDYD